MVTVRMIRSSRVLLAALITLAGLALSTTASADPRTAYLAEQLKTNDDYRVRTQAALALGASGDDAAVRPLCDGLNDSNVSVKVAAAAALGKLGKPGGASCLRSAKAKESAPAVKSQIDKSLATLDGGGGSSGGGGGGVGPNTKYYVAIQVTNKSGRPNGEIEGLVRGTMQSKLASRSGYAVAPKSETAAQGKEIVKGKRLKGFFLIATVEPPVYANGNLTQVVRVSVWTYPDKALQAEFAPKLTQEGTSKGDTASENLLVKMCIEHAMDTLHKHVASL